MVENYVVFAMERKDGIDGVPGGGSAVQSAGVSILPVRDGCVCIVCWLRVRLW